MWNWILVYPEMSSASGRAPGAGSRPLSSSSRSSVRTASTYKKVLSADLRAQAAGALEYVVPKMQRELPLSESERAARKVLTASDIHIDPRNFTLSNATAASERVPVGLGTARRAPGFDTYASVRAPHALLHEYVLPGGPEPAAATQRGYRADLKSPDRAGKLAEAVHEMSRISSSRGAERGLVATQALEVVVNAETGEIVEVTPASPEASARARAKPDVPPVSTLPKPSAVRHGDRYRRAEEAALSDELATRPAWSYFTSRAGIEEDMAAQRLAMDNFLGLRRRFGEREPDVSTPATKLIPEVRTEPRFRHFVVRVREAGVIEDAGAASARQPASAADVGGGAAASFAASGRRAGGGAAGLTAAGFAGGAGGFSATRELEELTGGSAAAAAAALAGLASGSTGASSSAAAAAAASEDACTAVGLGDHVVRG